MASRVKFVPVGDTESDEDDDDLDDDEEASRSRRSSTEESRSRVLDIMSTAKKGHALREAARYCADEYRLLCLGAVSCERLKVLRYCKYQRQQAMQVSKWPGNGKEKVTAKLRLLEVEKLWRKTLAELEESDFLCIASGDQTDLQFESRVEKQMDMMSWWETAFHDWVRALNSLTPTDFAEKVTLLRIEYGQENLNSFLQSLSLELPWTRVEARVRDMPGIELYASSPVQLTPWELFAPSERNFNVVGCEEVRGFTEADEMESFLASISIEKFEPKSLVVACSETWQVLQELGGKVFSGQRSLLYKATYSISPAVQLFELLDRDLAVTLKALVDAGQSSQCFNTVVGKALLREALHRTFWLRGLNVATNLCFVVLLVFLGRKVQTQQKPEHKLLVVFVFLGGWVFFSSLCKILTGLCLFVDKTICITSLLAAIGKHLTLWNALIVLSEAFTIFVCFRFMACVLDPHLTGFSFFETHPVMISALVLIRWNLLAIDFLQIEQVGRRVVPIVHAVSRPPSVYFLFFLVFILTGSFQAYSVFPIEENVGGANKVLDTFLKIFRLEVLGDFDLNELEGINDKLVARSMNGTIKGDVDSDPADWSDKYHRGVRFEFMALSLGVTVVVMNVYIGLLGSLYDKAAQKKNQLYSHYLASCCYRHLCEKQLQSCCLACVRRITKPPKQKQPGERVVWLAYDKVGPHLETEFQLLGILSVSCVAFLSLHSAFCFSLSAFYGLPFGGCALLFVWSSLFPGPPVPLSGVPWSSGPGPLVR